jgi:hypothetical protein
LASYKGVDVRDDAIRIDDEQIAGFHHDLAIVVTSVG